MKEAFIFILTASLTELPSVNILIDCTLFCSIQLLRKIITKTLKRICHNTRKWEIAVCNKIRISNQLRSIWRRSPARTRCQGDQSRSIGGKT